MGASQVMVAVAYLISARHSDPASLGIVLSTFAVGAVAAGILDFGQASFLIRERASGRLTGEDLLRKTLQKLTVTATLSALVVLLSLVLAVLAKSLYTVGIQGAVAGIVMLVTVLAQSFQVPLRARGQMLWVSASMVANRTVFLALVAILTAFDVGGAVALVVGLVAGMLTDCVASALTLWRTGNKAWRIGFSMRHLRASQLQGAWHGTSGYGLAAVVGSAQQLDVTLLAAVGGAATAGEYGAVSRWTSPLIMPSTALSQTGVLYAATARSMKESLRRLSHAISLLSIPIAGCVVVAVYAKQLTPLLLGEQYASSGLAFQILAIAVIPTILAQPLAMILQTRDREKTVSGILSVALILRLGGSVLLVGTLGAVAASIAVLLQQMFIFIALCTIAAALMRSESRK